MLSDGAKSSRNRRKCTRSCSLHVRKIADWSVSLFSEHDVDTHAAIALTKQYVCCERQTWTVGTIEQKTLKSQNTGRIFDTKVHQRL